MAVTSKSKGDAGGSEQRERLLHAVNDWIRIQDESIKAAGPIEFLCECGADDCQLTLELSVEEYDDLAVAPNRLLLASEHVGALDGHRVIAEHERYVVLSPAEQ
jgi:hypothetical protein